MAAAVEEHAQATDPHEVVAAEQRLRAQARQVAAGMSADANPPTAADYQPGAPAFDDGSSAHVPPSNGHAGSGYGQVGSPRVDDALERPPDPEIPADYDSRNYDGRRAEDWQAYQDRRDAER
jgi:hypothetical protein